MGGRKTHSQTHTHEKQVCNSLRVPPPPCLEKCFAKTFQGVLGFSGHDLPTSLQSPRNKPFSGPNSELSVCLASLCVGHTDLRLVTQPSALVPSGLAPFSPCPAAFFFEFPPVFNIIVKGQLRIGEHVCDTQAWTMLGLPCTHHRPCPWESQRMVIK